MTVIVAMLGARMHYAVPRLLNEENMLHQFYTDTYLGNKPRLKALLKALPACLFGGYAARLIARSDDAIPSAKVTSYDILGFRYAWALKHAGSNEDLDYIYTKYASVFNRRILASNFDNATTLWGFNGAALELFRAGKKRGMSCILEQAILPKILQDSLLYEESLRWPGWERKARNSNVLSKIHIVEQQEWQLADCIVAGSEFVRQGLVKLGLPSQKISVVPYGVELSRFTPNFERHKELVAKAPRPIRILFAGQIGLRKGVPDLLSALRLMTPGTFEARLAGSIMLTTEKIASQLTPDIHLMGVVSRNQMMELYRWADVFVLPSIVEGSATVTYEALASGLPVITTPNSGSMVRNGIDGWIVPIRSPHAIVNALRQYQEVPELLDAHSHAAIQGRDRLGLEEYRRNLIRIVTCK